MITRTGGEVKLAQDVADVLLDGVLGDEELVGDALVRATGGDECEDLELSGRQLVEWPGPPLVEQATHHLGVED